VKELAYQELFEKELPEHEFLGDIVKGKLHYYPTVTREPFRNQGRISDQINNGTFPPTSACPRSEPETDRVMLCGSPAMLADSRNCWKSAASRKATPPRPATS
jgi:ferredoxin--NADP+ reductase